MEPFILQLLLKKQNDIKWLIALRKADHHARVKMISEKCPICVNRISKNLYYVGDVELEDENRSIDIRIGKLMSGVDIQDLFE